MKKIISITVVVALITSSIPPREVEASWVSDFCGGLFTIITAPIWIFCPDNPTFRKNNPFRKKAWEEEDENTAPIATPIVFQKIDKNIAIVIYPAHKEYGYFKYEKGYYVKSNILKNYADNDEIIGYKVEKNTG
jgi:hypothetical protein